MENSREIRMSHIYQPAMLIELLKRGGTASVTDVAKALDLLNWKARLGLDEMCGSAWNAAKLTGK